MRNELFWEWYDDFAAPRLALAKARGVDRSGTFRKMFEHLDRFERPICIVETGCIEEPDNWAGNGCSTILFDRYIATHKGSSAYSFEINALKVEEARKFCPNVNFRIGDSVAKLKSFVSYHMNNGRSPVDLLYLDASHHDWVREAPSQVHHYRELMATMPLLREDSLVAVDDSVRIMDDFPMNKVIGKGGLVAQYALEIGAQMLFCEYQVGFIGVTNFTGPDVQSIEYLINRARAHVEAGEDVQADRLYRLVLSLTPPPWTGEGSGVKRLARGEACANFARQAHHMKRYGLASDWFAAALQADPVASDYRCELARSFVALESMKMAQRQAEIATEIEPDNPAAWATLGGIASDNRDVEATIAAYDRQIEAAASKTPPDAKQLSDAYLNRAVIAVDTRDYATAHKMCRWMHELYVRRGDMFQVLAIMAYRQSQHEKAIELFDQALAHDCRNKPLAHWNKSLPMQAIGQIKASWREHIWREFEPNIPAFYLPYHRFTKPKWKGEDGPGTVHVHTEAGHGDNIAMLRYFPLLQQKGLTVHYEADPSMLDLVQRNFPSVICMPRATDYPGVVGLKPFDWHHPIGDLPYIFGTDLDTIPWHGPYLAADPMMAKGMNALIPKGRRRIGLCWSSGIRRHISIWMETYGRLKSMPLKAMDPLFEDPDDIFVSLQVGDGRDEIDHRVMPIVDVLSTKPDWDETAAVLANLDLVITVDTGVAHLAGAMGVPCWVVMQKDGASWHFMCERPGAIWNERSPWYPSVRIFRQNDGSWASAIEKVREALRCQSSSTSAVTRSAV